LSATDIDYVAPAIVRINICLWVLFSWCRDSGNLEAAYLSSERALLLSWDKVKIHYTGRNKISKSFDSILDTYHQITDCYIDHCLTPYVKYRYALSHAVSSPCPIDVNFKLFDVLGRLSVKGHWILSALSKNYSEKPPMSCESDEQIKLRLHLRRIMQSISHLVLNNPILFSPFKDSQAIDIGLAVSLLSSNSEFDGFVQSWLSEMVSRCLFSFESNGMYPIVHNSYEKLLAHRNKTNSDHVYKNKATQASILYPLLVVCCRLYKLDSVNQELEQFAKDKLAHCTLQYWYPNQNSEHNMYANSDVHGSAFTSFPMNGKLALEHVIQECDNTGSLKTMSAFLKGKEALILTACRCYRYPVPFHYLEDLFE
ncbi:hypothetical protein, partial [Klebsiella pneumoniae]